jgi:hypothetical protein
MKATVERAKQLGALRGGFAGFKHNLMTFMGIPQDQFYTWDVPKEWKDAFLKANKRFNVKRTEAL